MVNLDGRRDANGIGAGETPAVHGGVGSVGQGVGESVGWIGILLTFWVGRGSFCFLSRWAVLGWEGLMRKR